MDPLTELAVGLKPELKSLIDGDETKAFEGLIIAAVKEITDAVNAAGAQEAINARPQVRTDLVTKLSTLAVTEDARQKAVAAKDDKIPAKEEKKTGPEDVVVAAVPNQYGWINPLLSMIITLGFMTLVFLLMFYPPTKVAGGTDIADNQVFNIALGALATAFATVIAFHFGSSVGSKDKDSVIAKRIAKDDKQPSVTP